MCEFLEPVLECHEANFETCDGYRVQGASRRARTPLQHVHYKLLITE